MRCPYCGAEDTRVVDSRSLDDGIAIRRRRECEKCGKRFTTKEIVESVPIVVIKKDGSRQEFDRKKLIERILRACQKRKVSMESIEQLADHIENEAMKKPRREISTHEIGDLVLQGLWSIDQVAYVRFASVYRDFESLDSFMDAIKNLKDTEPDKEGKDPQKETE
jgi:transcriptional repressor NrdR